MTTARRERAAGATVLAFDFGVARVGVAVGDSTTGIAHPLTTIAAADSRSRFAAIAALIEEWQPALLVVGVPMHDEERAHPVEALARRFARRLEGRFGIATHLVDERLTSYTAGARLRESGSRRRSREVLDAAAAQVILESYFAAR